MKVFERWSFCISAKAGLEIVSDGSRIAYLDDVDQLLEWTGMVMGVACPGR